MKQTAVEWFYTELKELIKQSELTEMKPSEFDDRETKLLEQAKEMEKKQQGYSEEDMIAFGEFIFKHTLLAHSKGVKNLFEQFKNK